MKKGKYISKMIFPIICIIVGIILLGYITIDYTKECEQAKWPSIDATVIDMDSYETGHGRADFAHTVYKTTYSYEVGNKKYTGEIRSYSPHQVGKNISVKYNPDNPSESTGITTPDTSRFVIAIIFGFVLVFVGILFTVIVWKNRFILSADDDTKHYPSPKQKRNPKAYLPLLLPIAVFLVGAVLMYFQPFAQKSIDSNSFVQIMQEDGYTAENSLQRLQNEFGMGSIIIEAYSVNTDNIRIDYCKLNSDENAKLLYDSATLSAKTYDVTEKQFLAGFDDDCYYVKAYNSNTFIYAACKIKSKDELLKLLSDMGYYKL